MLTRPGPARPSAQPDRRRGPDRSDEAPGRLICPRRHGARRGRCARRANGPRPAFSRRHSRRRPHDGPPAEEATMHNIAQSPSAARRVLGWLITGLVLIAVALSIGLLFGRGSTAATGKQPAAGAGQSTTESSAPATSTDEPSAPATSTDESSAPTSTDAGSSASDTTGTAPTESAPDTTDAPQSGEDLGLSTPISHPACDGQWIVLVGAATTPGRYPEGIGGLLESYPGSQYLVTEGSCSSLRQRTADGNLIYAVFLGPFPGEADACAMRAQVGGGAYVKVLDDTTPPEQAGSC